MDKDLIIKIAGRLFVHSFDPIGWDYYKLTKAERLLITLEEFNLLKKEFRF